MLADLGGGPVASGRQGEFDQPPVTEVFADSGMIHLYAQGIGLGVRMVRIEFSLKQLVGPDAAEVAAPVSEGGGDAESLSSLHAVKVIVTPATSAPTA